MQNVPRHGNAKNDSNSYQTLYGTSMVGPTAWIQCFSIILCSQRRPWFHKFRTKLGRCASLDEIEALLKVNVRRWRGLKDLSAQGRTEGKEVIDDDAGTQVQGVDLTGFLVEDELPDSYSMLELKK
jgi:hypothetical protein